MQAHPQAWGDPDPGVLGRHSEQQDKLDPSCCPETSIKGLVLSVGGGEQGT